MKSNFFKTVCFLFSLTVLISCGSSTKKSSTSKNMSNSTDFIEASYNVISFNQQNAENYNLSIMVSPKENLITGFSGCNNFQYTYTLKGEKLDLGLVVTSDMYCEETQKLENEFLGQVSKSTRFSIDGDELILTNEKKEVLVKAKRIE